MRITMIDYTYAFFGTPPFSNFYEFEKLFADFLESRGLEGELTKALDGGQGKRVIVISKKEVVKGMPENPPGRPQTVKGKIQQLSDRKLRKPAQDFMSKERKLRK